MNVCAVCEFWVQGKTQNLWVRCLGWGRVVYFEVQIALIFRRVWSERGQVVLSGYSVKLLCFVQEKTLL